MTPAGFPHSDTPGSTLGCQLPRAYRRLLRPSSALDAKASTMCPSQLVTHTTNPTHPHNNQKHNKDPTHPPPKGGTSRALTQKPSHQTDEPDVAVHTTHYKDARVHYPDLKQQPHTRPHATTRRRTSRPGSWNRSPRHTHPQGSLPGTPGLIPQNPNSVPPPTRHEDSDRDSDRDTEEPPKQTPKERAGKSMIPLVNTTMGRTPRDHRHRRWGTDGDTGRVLLRKEVIQPHLPVRLPCYDFVPIASPTFDHSPHTRWLGHGLRVLPTFVT